MAGGNNKNKQKQPKPAKKVSILKLIIVSVGGSDVECYRIN